MNIDSSTLAAWVAAVAAIAVAILTAILVHLARRHFSIERALDLIARWNAPAFADYRQDLMERGEPSIHLLNVMEEVGVAVRNRAADEAILKMFFYTLIVESYPAWRSKVEAHRERVRTERPFSHFQWLYEK